MACGNNMTLRGKGRTRLQWW